MGGAGLGVDVQAVGRGVDNQHLSAGSTQRSRAHLRGSAVGGVHGDTQAGQVSAGGSHQVVDVGLVSYGFALDYAADGGAGGALVLGGE